MNGELLRIVDSIHRDRDIGKEVILAGIETGVASALKKRAEDVDSIAVSIDRETGAIEANMDGHTIDPEELGRIAALTAKQVIMQKIREAERDVVYEDFEKKQEHLLTGIIQRVEGPNVIVNLGRTEGILPQRERIEGETYHPGDRLKFYVMDVKKSGQKVKVVLSRSHPDLIGTLFEMEVPEISEGIIEIKGIAREAGQRSKIAVLSNDPRVDCVGACVGVRGARIKSIVSELNGEKIDIVEWSDDHNTFVGNALKPAEDAVITLNEQNGTAVVSLPQDQLSLAIGKRGQNVRLASKLTGFDIDIVSAEGSEDVKKTGKGVPAEPSGLTEEKGGIEGEVEPSEVLTEESGAPADSSQDQEKASQSSETPAGEREESFESLCDLISDEVAQRMRAAGISGVTDIKDAGPELIAEVEGVDADLARAIYGRAVEETEGKN